MALLDLHIHSALSPCASREMAAPAVLLTAERQGVGTVGIVDHSSAGNAPGFLHAAPAFAASVLVGLEIESVEGVHLLALFDNAAAALAMDELVRRHLPVIPNRPDLFGEQTLLNEWGDERGREPHLLLVSSTLSVERIAEETLAREGLSIAAHVDRTANGLLPTLGIIPPRLRVDLFEVSSRMTTHAACVRWPQLAQRPLLFGSDAHCLSDIGQAPTAVPAAVARPTGSLRQWAGELAEALLSGSDDP